MSLFNTQKKKVGNATAGETKLSAAPQKPVVAEKKAVKASTASKSEKRAVAAQGVSFPKGSAIIKPRITEKAGLLSQSGVYTFDVRIDASSHEIA
ncbi:MAG TPA: hypothetical protein VFT82_01795, partial [Candidatus Paceibacterota bacterium]|nr:hypothetical protein [Candidatus Paceibacterota bacterium]